MGQKKNVVPGSDLAGEIIALGTDVSDWAVGDRVCSNFAVDHIFGETSAKIRQTGLGAPIDGVLTEYKVLPARVGRTHAYNTQVCRGLTTNNSHSCVSRNT